MDLLLKSAYKCNYIYSLSKLLRFRCFFAIEKCTQTAIQTQELEKCSSEKVDTTPISNIFGK